MNKNQSLNNILSENNIRAPSNLQRRLYRAKKILKTKTSIETKNIGSKFPKTNKTEIIETEKLQKSAFIENVINSTCEKLNNSYNNTNKESTLQHIKSINTFIHEHTTSETISSVCEQLNSHCNSTNNKLEMQQSNNINKNETASKVQPSTSNKFPEEKKIIILNSITVPRNNSSNLVPDNPTKYEIERIFIHEHDVLPNNDNYEDDPLKSSKSQTNDQKIDEIEEILVKNTMCLDCDKNKANIVFLPCKHDACRECWKKYRDNNRTLFEKEGKSIRIINQKMKKLECMNFHCRQIIKSFISLD